MRTCGTAAAVGAVLVASRSYAASASAGVSATIIAPVAVARNTDLAFSAPSSAIIQVVLLKTDGRGNRTRDATSPVLSGSPASLIVSGNTNASYAVTIAPSVSAARAGGIGTVTIAPYVIRVTGAPLSSAGPQTVLIGGRLMPVPAQADGVYSGNLAVTIEYN